MMEYTLPRELYDLLEEAFGQKQKAEIFARAIESAIREIQRKASEDFAEHRKHTKVEVKEELRTELVTSERFGALEAKIDERFKVVDERFNALDERFSALETKIDARFKVVDERFKVVDEQFKMVNEQFKMVNEQFKVVEEHFKALEAKMDERFKVVDEKFKALSFKLNMFLAVALIALTFANPTFAKVLEKLFGF